jgi:hypothetical protein
MGKRLQLLGREPGDTTMFRFRAESQGALGFEEFLRLAERTGEREPGTALVAVLRSRRVPGIDLERILNNPRLNPVDRPENLLRFLSHIAERGGWGVNLDVRID